MFCPLQEMYGFAIAASQAPGGPIWHDLKPEFLVHPPWDSEIKGSNGLPAYILHYTYGAAVQLLLRWAAGSWYCMAAWPLSTWTRRCLLALSAGFDFDEAGQFTPGKVGQWHWDKVCNCAGLVGCSDCCS